MVIGHLLPLSYIENIIIWFTFCVLLIRSSNFIDGTCFSGGKEIECGDDTIKSSVCKDILEHVMNVDENEFGTRTIGA